MSRPAMAVFALLAGCSGPTAGSAATTPPTPASAPASVATAELSPALAPLAWWLGDWQAADGATEHWIAAAGAIYGVALHGTTYEVLIVDDGDGPGRPDGELRLFAMPDGERSVEFRQRTFGEQAVTFANDAHDFPKTITYQRTADGGLAAVLGGGKQVEFQFRPRARQPAPELEAADLAFAADTARRGVDGWMAAFAPDGAMMRRTTRVEHAAIAELMRPTLTSGRLAWAPIASGMAGELGFTVGKAEFTAPKPEDSWRSTYVTIWRRQPGGEWKVLFDTGRIVHDE